MELWHASTLASFTEAIRPGLVNLGGSTTLIQIHGSPAARDEDRSLLDRAREISGSKVFLLHRPDEILLDAELRRYFELHPESRLLFLGDLIYRETFWAQRRALCRVIPHPQLDLSLPTPSVKLIVGAFTSWGEMRDPRHYFELVNHLSLDPKFEFRIGGTGLEGVSVPKTVQITTEPFVSHFNVQLYHLQGRKRYGESSGSLHRGVSIPVIFEANGAERLEGLHVIKIQADDELQTIEFARAADEIMSLTAAEFEQALRENWNAASRNSVARFGRDVAQFVESFSRSQ